MISYDMTNDAYHNSVGISKSGLDLIAKSPAHYNASLHKRVVTPSQATAFLIGSAVHTAVLEPKEFRSRYVMVDADMRTKEGKQAKADAMETGKDILTADQYLDVVGMQNSVMNHPVASDLLKNGDPEVSCLCDINGTHARARADWLRKDGIIVDLKTTADASEDEFAKSIATFNYHRQAAWYKHLFTREGLDIDRFVFIAVEKTAPYSVAVYELDDDDVEYGLEECLRLFSIYRECLLNEDWPSYPQQIKTLRLPLWKKRQELK